MDYLHAALSVLSQKSEETGPCPDPETLAAFSEGRLHGKERKKIMAHMNDCADCRRHWHMIASVLDDMETRKTSWLEKTIHTFKKLKKRRAVACGGLGLALTTCLLFIFLIPKQNELSRMIANSYANLSPDIVSRYNSFVSKGDEGDLEKPPSEDLLAYKAGLASGKDRLSSQTGSMEHKEFEDEWHASLYSLGQWTVVLQCACISPEPVPDEFWLDQEAIALQLHETLSNADPPRTGSKEMRKTAAIIKNAIEEIRATGDHIDGCEEIALAIETFENRLRKNN